jgi:DNA ligase-4
MPFPFSSVCELLARLERLKLRGNIVQAGKPKEDAQNVVEIWFRRNRGAIDARDTDQVALLSTLFPERRTDRVYGMRELMLSKIIARCLNLNKAKTAILQSWKTPGAGDLGICVEKAIQDFDCERTPGTVVTVEEIDQALESLASQSRFSGPEIRSSALSSTPPKILENIFLRLKSSEAKWLTRLILKDYSPVSLDEAHVLTSFHFLLPGLLHFQDSFAAVISQLRGPLSKYHSRPDYISQSIFRREAAKSLRPQIGVKVGRPPFVKARSIQHAVQLAGTQKWTVERKYDGEYCEIHIDLEKSGNCIKIFSKSGKDSTKDRKHVHSTIQECLRIHQPDCIFKKKCIVIGELVVWSDRDNAIAGFEKLRKWIPRSGVFIGTGEDSQRQPWEHLMIVFFDLLLLDDDIIMRKPQLERRNCLSRLIKKRRGYAVTAERTILDFSSQSQAPEMLCHQLAAALSYRQEGLVMKPADMPYFAFDMDEASDQRGYFIKLKKDYLQELGGERDVADFAVVGASYDPKQAQKSGLRAIQYTTFHLGCVVEEETLRFNRKSTFEIVGTITQEQCIPQPVLQALNDYGRFNSRKLETGGNIRSSNTEGLGFNLQLDTNATSKMDVIFTEPCVVEVLGSSYEKVQNKNYFMLRHPRILKLHLDRDWRDATSMPQLKRLAEEARNAPVDGESQELSQLTKKLMSKFKRKVESQQLRAMSTQRTETTLSPGSTRRKPPSSRRSPTFVRIDTSELLPGEVHEMSSEQRRALISAPSDNSLRAIPNSASLNQPHVVTGSPRRRKRIDVYSTPLPTALKRARTEPGAIRASLSRPLAIISSNPTRSFPAPQSNKQTNKAHRPKLVTSNSEPHQQATTTSGTNSCNNANCLFSQSVAYLSPCISRFTWVSDNLLKYHGTARTHKLPDWQREIQQFHPLGSMVSESPAWPGRRKIVLVETNRAQESRTCVDEVMKLMIRDEIVFLDWRVLEEMRVIEESDEGSARGVGEEVLRRHFYGRTRWLKEIGGVEFLDTMNGVGENALTLFGSQII